MSKKTKAVFGNHPYTENAKKDSTILLNADNIGKFIYPDEGLDYSDLNDLYLSTDKLTVCSMTIGPGGFFNPPDYHPGDEAYFITEGTITQFCPATGQCIQVNEDESLLIPKGVIHSAYNFAQKKVKVIAVIAPKIVENQLFPTDTLGPKKTLQSLSNNQLKSIGEWDEPSYWGSIDNLGEWPAKGSILREKGILYHISESKKLLAIHGDTRPILAKFSISNDFMQLGEYILPSGGVVCRHSEVINHKGQCVLIGLDGVTTIYLVKERETFQVKRYEGVFIPENIDYQILNYEQSGARCLFAIEGGEF